MNTKLWLVVLAVGLASTMGCEDRNQPGQTQTASGPITQGTPQATPGAKPWLVGAEQGLKPTLLIANFTTDSDDKLFWGPVISQILVVKLNYAPREVFSMPIPGDVDGEYRHLRRIADRPTDGDGYSVDEAIVLARMFGLDRAVTGNVTKCGEDLTITAEIRDARTSQVLTRVRLEGPVSDAAKLLVDFSNRIFHSFGKELFDASVREYLNRPIPANGESVRQCAALWSNRPTSAAVEVAAWQKLCAAEPQFTFAKVAVANKIQAVSVADALAEAKRLHEADPHQGRLWILYIALLDRNERYPEAIKECTEFLRENPNNLTALWRLDRAYRLTEDYEASLAVTERLLHLKPDSWQSHFYRAVVCDKYGWAKRGHEYWNKVPPEGQRIFGEMNRICIAELEQTLKMNPNHAEALAMLAGCYTDTGAPESVIELLCRQAIEIEPDNWAAQYNLVRLCMPGYTRQPSLQMAHQRALAVCREAAERSPRSASMQWLMADYLLWYIGYDHSRTGIPYQDFLKDPEYTKPIEESITKALALQPGAREWRANAANYYYRKHDYKTAWEHYSQLTDYIPQEFRKKDVALHEWYAVISISAARADQWEQAYGLAQKGLALNPCPQCHESLLVAFAGGLQHRKEYDEALKNFEQLAQASQLYKSWALKEYATIVFEHRPALIAKGFECAKQAVAHSPKDAPCRYTLSRYHCKRGEKKDALDQVNAALTINPKHKDARTLRAEILGSH